MGSQWEKLPGLAKDIGVGANGSAWIIGTNPVGTNGDFGVHRWTGTDWDSIDGGGVRIDVDAVGNPWIVNANGEIFQRLNNRWQKLPGLARDIGVGANGAAWIVGTNPVAATRLLQRVAHGFRSTRISTPVLFMPPQQKAASDFGVYRWTGSSWAGTDGGGIRIDVDGQGNPWLVNRMGEIFRRVNDQWQKISGLGRDIGAGPRNSVWVIGTNRVGVSGDFGVHKWTGRTGWQGIDGGGIQISVDDQNLPWVVNSRGEIYRRR